MVAWFDVLWLISVCITTNTKFGQMSQVFDIMMPTKEIHDDIYA